MTDRVAKPVVEPITEPVEKPLVAPITEPVEKPGARLVAEPVVEHVVRPVAESVVESAAQPVVPSVAPAARPVAEPVAGPVVKLGVRPVAEPVAEPVVRPGVDSVAEPVAEPVVRPGVDSVAQPVVERVMRPVGDSVVQPVVGPATEHVVRPVVKPVGDVVGAEVGGAVEVRPEVPALPVVPDLPASLPLQPQTGPVASAPRAQPQQRPGGANLATSSGHSSTPKARTAQGVTASSAAAHGPRYIGATSGTGGAAVHVRPHRSPRAGLVAPLAPIPAHQGPAGGPDGMLGDHAAADSGTSRHGDAHAVTVPERAPSRLVPGAAARAAALGARDRHQAVPVFPG
ncbi:hypothetical protein [Streptomyces sp. 6-11-2]|uniref:hypothetical protein n=1 Tax=Streptomyces sp. 6-11-2 TaxID=2585753 RepID=UPI001142C754|nr:hypothetical protein [Streptomyces sp. 6-11-2]GED85244.1 hypothetical protein TNCT6_23290 [Streptomyces sp. 6-11-2]